MPSEPDRVRDLVAQALRLEQTGQLGGAAVVLNDAGLGALDHGDSEQAEGLFERAAILLIEAGSPDAAAAVANLALVRSRMGRLDVAAQDFARALELIRASSAASAAIGADSPNDLREANIRVNLGGLQRRLGELSAAADSYEHARTLYARLGRCGDLLDVEINLAVLDERAGRLDRARERLVAVQAEVPRSSLTWALAATTLAAVAGRQSRFNEASSLLASAYKTFLAHRRPRDLANVVSNQGYVAMSTGRLGEARRHLSTAEAMYEAMGMALDQARLLAGLGSLALRTGQSLEAIVNYESALELYVRRDLVREIAATQVNLGVAYALLGDWEHAEMLHRAAVEQCHATSNSGDVLAHAVHNLGFSLASQGRFSEAEACLDHARTLYADLGLARETASLDSDAGIVAAAQGRQWQARRLYTRAAKAAAELGLHVLQARFDHNLGLTWAAGTTERRSRVLTAWLVLDSTRFSLDDPAERAHFRTTVQDPTAAAFEEAARSSPLLQAEVIERARAVGTLRSQRPESDHSGTPPLLSGARRPASAAAQRLAVTSPPRIAISSEQPLDAYLDRAERRWQVDETGRPVPPSLSRGRVDLTSLLLARCVGR